MKGSSCCTVARLRCSPERNRISCVLFPSTVGGVMRLPTQICHLGTTIRMFMPRWSIPVMLVDKHLR